MAHLVYQAYEIYLARGGHPIPITPVRTATALRIDPQFAQHLRRVMVLITLAEETPQNNQIETLQRCYAKLAGGDVPRDQLIRDMELATAAQTDAATYVTKMLDHLSSEQQRTLIHAACLAASTGGPLQTSQLQQLQRLGQVLGFTDYDLRTIIAEVTPNCLPES